MLTIEVEGYAAAKRILDELPNTMQKRMLLAALRASAKPMLQSARSKVPVLTGKLKKQLRTVRYKDRNASKSEVAIAVKPVFERTAAIFGDELAAAVEKFVNKNFAPVSK